MSEQDNQVAVATNTDDTQDVDLNLEDLNIEDTEQVEDVDVDALKEQLQKRETFAKQAIARAKKAEAELKALKNTATQITNKPQDSQEAIEKTVLKAQGMSDELLASLEKVAKVSGKSLLDAQNDPIFLALKQAKDEEVKAEKAKLGASRGSASVKKEKSFNTPGLSEAEFKELWKAKMGR